MADDGAQDVRLERLLEVIALASLGDFDDALALFEAPREDTYGILSEGLRIFIAELRDAQTARAEAMSELQQAKLEIEQKLKLIEDQRAEIRALSSPVLDLWDGVLAVPLVGRVDEAAMSEVTERVLARVVARRARRVLIDLTGIEAIDAGTADHLDRLARAIRLVGGDCLFTGIGAAAAASLVEYGATGAIRSVASLREGLRVTLAGRTSR